MQAGCEHLWRGRFSKPAWSGLLSLLVLGAVTGLERLGVWAGEGGVRPRINSPLRVFRSNPLWFSDAQDKAVVLVGSHTWNNLQDMGTNDPPSEFNFKQYLDFLDKYHHNFIRMWRWELTSWDTSANNEQPPQKLRCSPHPWLRSGPGIATDGKPKFDLSKFDESYFRRLRERVAQANARGIYVSVMLFEGWGMQFVKDAWRAHPFHPENSINGVDADTDGDGRALELYTLALPQVTALQEAYVRKVIETVGDFDNVLFEISNENHPGSTDWQYHFIRFIKQVERTRPKQHPVGMTFQYRGGKNKTLFDSPADWISPNPDAEDGYNYRENPPPNDGRKVIINDTDHLWGIGGDESWVWKSFTRGMNPIFMDPYDNRVLGRGNPTRWEGIRRAQGIVLSLAERIDLTHAKPMPALASTSYCLAVPGREYVIYAPGPGQITVDLSGAQARFHAEWIDPVTGTVQTAPSVEGGSQKSFNVPWNKNAVFHLYLGR